MPDVSVNSHRAEQGSIKEIECPLISVDRFQFSRKNKPQDS